MSDSRFSDLARQIINLIAAPAMMLLSNLPFIFEAGRTPSEFSDQNDSLLVPLGPAFSIWLLIFITCIAYGIVQCLPKNRTRDIFRRIGWWTAAGFIMVNIWSLVSAFAPTNWVLWGTAFAFVPLVAFLIKAMLILSASKGDLRASETYTVWLPISLIAGWTSIAMFLNWTPIVSGLAAGLSPVITALVMLGAALIFGVSIIRASGGNKAYAFPIIWGLTFLAIKRFTVDPVVMPLAIGACLGIAIVATAAVISGRKA